MRTQYARGLVLLPTYNESENVLPLPREILTKDPTLTVLVVDDSSPDGTGERESLSDPRLRLLRRPGKLGLGGAYLAGFRHGIEHGFDLVLTIDCDRSHHPRYLPEIIKAARQADLVIGSRYVPGGAIANWPPAVAMTCCV